MQKTNMEIMLRLNKREILYRILQICTLKNRRKEGKKCVKI